MNGSRFSSFLLIISKHWNTLQLNGFIPRKVWDYYSVAAIKLNETVLILAKEPLSVKEEKCVLRTRHFSPVISPQRSAVNRPGGVCCEFYVFLCHSICFWRKLREEKKKINARGGSLPARRPWLSPSCPLLSRCIALATHEETSGAPQDWDIRVNTNLGGMW